MSVVALVIAPSIAMSSENVTAYVNDQTEEAIELIVPGSDKEESITIKINTENKEQNTAIEVSMKGTQEEVFNNLNKVTSVIDDVIGN